MESSDGLGDLKNQESPDYRNRAFVHKLVILKKLGKRKKNRQSRGPQKKGSILKIWLHCVARLHT